MMSSLANAQDPIEKLIVGDWKQATSKGDSLLIHFDADRSMFMQNKNQTFGKGKIKLQNGDSAKFLMRYVISDSEQYKNIDFLYALDNFYNTIGKSEGIIEILSPNMLKFAMNYDKPTSTRPTNFYNAMETQILKRVNSIEEECDCEKFRNGKFKLVDIHTGTTIITRNENIQIEENAEVGVKIKLKVNWLDKCTYTLELVEYLSGEDWMPNNEDMAIIVNIIYTGHDSYIQTSSIANSEMIRTNEIEVIE